MRFGIESGTLTDGDIVTVEPDTPDGFFVSTDDVCGIQFTRKLGLLLIRAEHVEAVKKGDDSVMQGYIKPARNNTVEFTNCWAAIEVKNHPVQTLLVKQVHEFAPDIQEADLRQKSFVS